MRSGIIGMIMINHKGNAYMVINHEQITDALIKYGIDVQVLKNDISKCIDIDKLLKLVEEL